MKLKELISRQDCVGRATNVVKVYEAHGVVEDLKVIYPKWTGCELKYVYVQILMAWKKRPKEFSYHPLTY